MILSAKRSPRGIFKVPTQIPEGIQKTRFQQVNIHTLHEMHYANGVCSRESRLWLTLCSTKVNKAIHVNLHYSNRLLLAEYRSGCDFMNLFIELFGPSEQTKLSYYRIRSFPVYLRVKKCRYLSLCILQGRWSLM